MKIELDFGMQNPFENQQKISYVQDTIHIGTKLRNLLLKSSAILPMGNKQVSVSHLKILINTVPKDVHGLVLKDICPDDRQNFGSLLKVMEPRVLDALSKFVPDCEATVAYLRLCKQVTSSFIDFDLSPLERIHRMWHAVYFLRIWRKFIVKSKVGKKQSSGYTLTNNFITANAYACIEINAQSLLNLIRKFRNEKADSECLLTIFNSQTCEKTFRQLRSMTTINWTKINFSILELTHLIGRVELLNDITHFKLKNIGIEFPRVNQDSVKQKIFALPSDEDLQKCMKEAQSQALNDALKFGMHIEAKDIQTCELSEVDFVFEYENETPNTEYENETPNGALSQFDFIDDDDDTSELCDVLSRDLCLKDYSEKCDEFDENSKFVQITNKAGKIQTVRKSSLVWLLSESKGNLSCDRLQRVKNSSVMKTSSTRRLEFSSLRSTNGRILFLSDQLCIGQWCIFKIPSNIKLDQPIRDNPIPGYVVGGITGFKYSNGKSEKEKQYSWDTASIENQNIEVSASWYFINQFGEFITSKNYNIFFINIKNYMANIIQPSFDKVNEQGSSIIHISTENLKKLIDDFKKL